MLLAGLRRRHDFAAAEAGIAEQWRSFASMPPIPGRTGANRYGVMCGADATGMEYMCAVEVEAFDGLPAGVGRMRVPARRYAVFPHQPAASGLRSTWEGILAWLERDRYESAHTPDFELYAPSGTIEVWVGVVPRGGASP